tara:strand:+ start:211 stop:453 length:243 start_codon:yes stop_codon:yes gene_type:complete
MTKCIYYVNESALDITKYTLKNFCDAFNDEEYAEISDSNYIYLTEKEAKEKLKELKDWQSDKKQEVADFFGGQVKEMEKA